MEMMEKMMGSMDQGEMKKMMEQMMSKCCGDISQEHKEKAAKEIKTGCCEEGEMPQLPQMIMKMMPHCIEMILPKLSEEERNKFVVEIASILFAKEKH